MARFNKINVDASVAYSHSNFARELYKEHMPIGVHPLRSCHATVLHYGVNGGDVYLLKSYNNIVAMVDEVGDGIDFLRYVYGYTATSAQHIRKFFDDYCNEYADIYTYKAC